MQQYILIKILYFLFDEMSSKVFYYFPSFILFIVFFFIRYQLNVASQDL